MTSLEHASDRPLDHLMCTGARSSVEHAEASGPEGGREPSGSDRTAVGPLASGTDSVPVPGASGTLPSPSSAQIRIELANGREVVASTRSTPDVPSGKKSKRRGPPVPPEVRLEWRRQRRESNRRARIESEERRRGKVEAEEKRIAELEDILRVRSNVLEESVKVDLPDLALCY